MTKIAIKSEASGFFKIEATKPDGSTRVLADWFPNLITNVGLDMFGTNENYLYGCSVGTGSTTPAFTDTGLSSSLATTHSTSSNSSGTNSSPSYAWRRITWVFSIGAAAGNLSEVGILGYSGNAFSHALILDGLGSPTTITVLGDEILSVTYELRKYSPTSDVTGTVHLDGVDYAWVCRASNVWSWGASPTADTTSIYYVYWFSGSIGADIFSAPSGTNNRSDGVTDSYSTGTYTRTGHSSIGISEGNYSGGIGAVTFQSNDSYQYQIGFTPKIPKDNTKNLSLSFAHSWSRH